MDKEQKPLRQPLKRDSKGRFAENMADFTPEQMALAIAEFEAKPGVSRETVKGKSGR